MKLYNVELRKKMKDGYIYGVENQKIVSKEKLLNTIHDFLNSGRDGDLYVMITHVEADV